MSGKALSGVIFNIQSYSVHDGPGIRTLVFFKGCPLKCKWCSNPESQYPGYQWRYREGACRKDCPQCHDSVVKNAIMEQKGDPVTLFLPGDPRNNDGKVPCCPFGALEICGYQIDSKKLVSVIENDRPFFGEDGGVTISGGEPFTQPDFLIDVLKQCKNKGINTAVETCLYAPFNVIEAALPYIDFFMFDLKLIDTRKHLEYCGADNRLIKENVHQLIKVARVPLLPRMPVVPGVNDDDTSIAEIAQFMTSLDLHYLNLLPFMPLGIGKYKELGMKYGLPGVKAYGRDELDRIKKKFYQLDIFCI